MRDKLLITGASGFLGRRVVAVALERGYDVVGLTRSSHPDMGIDEIVADLTSARFRADQIFSGEARIAALIHLAWIATPPLFWTSPENRIWRKNSFRLLSEFIKCVPTGRLVAIGSSAEYGEHVNAAKEDEMCCPHTEYGIAKLQLLEDVARYAKQQRFTNWIWLRLFQLYGIGEPPTKLISSLIGGFLTGSPIRIENPNWMYDYVNVEDAAAAIVESVESKSTGVFNLASGAPYAVSAVESLVRECLEEAGIHIQKADQPMGYARSTVGGITADVTKMRGGFKRLPRMSLKERVAEMIRAKLDDNA